MRIDEVMKGPVPFTSDFTRYKGWYPYASLSQEEMYKGWYPLFPELTEIGHEIEVLKPQMLYILYTYGHWPLYLRRKCTRAGTLYSLRRT